MKINEKTIIKSICGIKSDISVGEFLTYLLEEDDLSYGYEIDEIIDFLNEEDGIMKKPGYLSMDDWEFTNYDGLEFSIKVQYDEGVTQFLENCFGEKYLMMVCTRFCYQNFDHDSKGEIWQDPGMSIDLVESIIEGDGKEIFKIITKGHYENEINNINENNFLTDEEKKKLIFVKMIF